MQIKPLGEILVQEGFISRAELERVLDKQRNTFLPLGEILVNEKIITQEQLERALEIQRHRMSVQFKSIGEILKANGVITEELLAKALEEQEKTGKKVEQVLIERGYVQIEDVGRALESQTGLEYVDLSVYPIDAKAVYLLPEHVVKKYQVLPIRREGDKLYVAMLTPQDIAAVDEIELLTGYKVVPMIVLGQDLARSINYYFEARKAAQEAIEGAKADAVPARAEAAERVEELVESAPVIQLVDSIIQDAVNYRATDIHLDPQGDYTLARYRIDGKLQDAIIIPKEIQAAVISRIMIMGGMNIAEQIRPQDGHIQMSSNGRPLDLRVASSPTLLGQKAEIRIFDRGHMFIALDRLGLNERCLKVVESLLNIPYGMILVTGPTGSGKTTTLYSMLSRVNEPTKSVVTIEDPVELQFARVNQIQVNLKAGITFASGLRTIMRQDPNVIMVGEIRDIETAHIAIHAALTGHLLLSTLHTTDASSSVARLVAMGAEPYLVAASLIGVIAQRLIRIICPHCKKESKLPTEILEHLNIEIPAGTKFYKGVGCGRCNKTGYFGRTGVFEVLQVDDEIRGLILERQPAKVIRKKAVGKGMQTLFAGGLEKVFNGESTLEEVFREVYISEGV